MVAIPVSGRLQKGGPAHAPPGFRVASRAVFVVTAIRRQSLPPSRLRRCALCLPPGDRRKAHPRRAMLGAPGGEPNRLAPDRPGQRPTARAGFGGYAGACCRGLRKYVPPSTLAVRCLAVTKDGSRGFTDMAARPCRGVPHHASSVAAAGRVRGALPPVVGDWPCPCQGACRWNRRAGMPSWPCLLSALDRPKASLSGCESWRWRGLDVCNLPAQIISPPLCGSSRDKLLGLAGASLRCAHKRCSPPVPRRSDHNKDAMGANLVQP